MQKQPVRLDGSTIPIKKATSAPNIAGDAKNSNAVKSLVNDKNVKSLIEQPIGFTEEELFEWLNDMKDKENDEKTAVLEEFFSWTSNNYQINTFKLAQIVESVSLLSYEANFILNKLKNEINLSTNDFSRECCLMILKNLLLKLGRVCEPVALPLLPKLLLLYGDRSNNVRDLTSTICNLLMDYLCPNSFRILLPMLLDVMNHEDWRIKVGSLLLLKAIAPRVSVQVTPLLPVIIPIVSECIIDSKKQVQTAGIDVLTETCKSITNDDIRPLVPHLVSVIARPDEATATLDLLLETTFVASVDASVLSLIAPLLGKTLRTSRLSATKRKAAKVIDIMCRLVQDPSDVAPFIPLLLPALDKMIDEIVDEEVCQVGKEARSILLLANGEGTVTSNINSTSADKSHLINAWKQKLHELLIHTISELPNNYSDNINATILSDYISLMCAYLLVYSTLPNPCLSEIDSVDHWRAAVAMSPIIEWKNCIAPYLCAFIPGDSSLQREEAEKLSASYRSLCLGTLKDYHIEEDDGDTICNIEFSLAFGGKILLHNTHLTLKRGRRYCIMGKNGAGKTTLLTNIGNNAIEGLPATLKTVYVQHDDRSDDFGINIVDETLACKALVGLNVTTEDIVKALSNIGFTDTMLTSPRSQLSGGWKMKLLIIRAMLSNADVLLLDEPTNHLDAKSVQWLVDYIRSQANVTCLIVSHDIPFLDLVSTDIIHYENKKLVYYHGNLTHFVEIHPEAKYYYELDNKEITLAFKFPTPERLEGINSTTRAVMKLDNVNYTYPGATKPTLTNVSVKVCLGSRIAVLGENGAGKSTLIKMLVQETEPDANTGSVWKHMNLRVAYVAQHSFHHIDQHLEVSPVQYFKWRFAGGVDREEMSKATTKLTDEEIAEKKSGIRKYGDIDEVLGRRKNGRTMEYECTFVGQNPKREPNKYIPLETMIEMGLQKLVQQCDAKIAAMAAGLDLRPLVTAEIQGHLNDFNLDAEFGTHSTIKRLSGGQKVKLVLAGAMWNRPHIIILDEPTNYLDREAICAVTAALKEFHGGVVIISHNSEFTDAICTEKWLVKDGHCFTTGEAEDVALKVASEKSLKRSNSAPELQEKCKDDAGGNLNKSIVSDVVLNPRTLEGLSKKETRKLEKLAQVAGVSLKDYVSKLTFRSPEWKWL